MDSKSPTVALESGLDLRKIVTSGSVLQINDVYDDTEFSEESIKVDSRKSDILGREVKNFYELEKTMFPIDLAGYVKKKLLEEGGGLPLNDDNTVSVAFSGFWENDPEPFDTRKLHKPLVVDLKDNGLLPGLQIAIRSMLVGEISLFLFSHEVMYGELGIPPRIKPKAKCAFYIKLIKSIITPIQGEIDFSEQNMFQRVLHESKLLFSSGYTLYKTKNIPGSIQLFKKAVYILQKCRLADEHEEKIQERMLTRLYLNLAVCYNKNKQPLRACIACNELNRLSSLWNNAKALLQNAISLRMIGEFDKAEQRLKRAKKLHKGSNDIEAFANEESALRNARNACNQVKLLQKLVSDRVLVSEEFKNEVDKIVKNFKESPDLYKLVMPSGLNSSEVAYIREACIRENLFFSNVKKDIPLESEENVTNDQKVAEPVEKYALNKFKSESSSLRDDDSCSNEDLDEWNENCEGDGGKGESDEHYEYEQTVQESNGEECSKLVDVKSYEKEKCNVDLVKDYRREQEQSNIEILEEVTHEQKERYNVELLKNERL